MYKAMFFVQRMDDDNLWQGALFDADTLDFVTKIGLLEYSSSDTYYTVYEDTALFGKGLSVKADDCMVLELSALQPELYALYTLYGSCDGFIQQMSFSQKQELFNSAVKFKEFEE